MDSLRPLARKGAPLPLSVLLNLNSALQKTILSRKFYLEVNTKILTQALTLDANLYFICYFTLLLSSVLNNKHRIRAFLASQKKTLLAVLSRLSLQTIGRPLPRGFTDKKPSAEVSTAETALETSAAKPSALAVHLKAISSYIADVRIFNRLVDSMRYMPWILDEFAALSASGSNVPRLDRLVNFAQSINCLILELLENAGWLTEHNWVATNDNNYWCIETYIWCSRVWGAYLVIEIIELFRRTPRAKWNRDWKINLFTQVVQMPLVLHWSLYDGCLSPFWVGLCGSGASYFGFRKVWSTLDL